MQVPAMSPTRVKTHRATNAAGADRSESRRMEYQMVWSRTDLLKVRFGLVLIVPVEVLNFQRHAIAPTNL